jgi:predicted glycogen debranching enzyme
MDQLPHRRIALPQDLEERATALLEREWLVTNGLGGYASGTVAGLPTRRYHGVLVASLPNPHGRMVMLTELRESLVLPDGSVHDLAGEHFAGEEPRFPGVELLDGFELEAGLPVWRYRIRDHVLEKRVLLPHRQNTVHVCYRLLEGGGPVRLRLLPAVNFREQEKPVSTPLAQRYTLRAVEDRIEIEADPLLPQLRMRVEGGRTEFRLRSGQIEERLYGEEERRGYDACGDLWTPGCFDVELGDGASTTFVASTEDWATVLALPPEAARAAERERRAGLLARAAEPVRSGVGSELVLAADAFLVSPGYRGADVARRRAAGDDVRTVIAGYHWFTDWGRDTMIALEGLTLATGRHDEAATILRTFAHYSRDGLIPNMFPEGSSDGLYHTADASLWFFHAADRHFHATSDSATLKAILPTLRSIVRHHLEGTRHGIRIDADDGLMTQGEEGYQLTWMDAKVDGWVVTPRRGKAVELNALWYNALRLLEEWSREHGDGVDADELRQHADRARASFNRRFWDEDAGHLRDIVDGEDPEHDDACRPNQLFALSLRHPVLEEGRWEAVLRTVERDLLTPVGLRSLAPGHPSYRPNYRGNLRERDAAYHQGTTWGWLIGPFFDAYRRVRPDDMAGAQALLDGLIDHLDHFGVGSVAEIFDAEPPYTPRGCIAQAWSVSEVLRCLADRGTRHARRGERRCPLPPSSE